MVWVKKKHTKKTNKKNPPKPKRETNTGKELRSQFMAVH